MYVRRVYIVRSIITDCLLLLTKRGRSRLDSTSRLCAFALLLLLLLVVYIHPLLAVGWLRATPNKFRSREAPVVHSTRHQQPTHLHNNNTTNLPVYSCCLLLLCGCLRGKVSSTRTRVRAWRVRAAGGRSRLLPWLPPPPPPSTGISCVFHYFSLLLYCSYCCPVNRLNKYRSILPSSSFCLSNRQREDIHVCTRYIVRIMQLYRCCRLHTYYGAYNNQCIMSIVMEWVVVRITRRVYGVS